MKNYPGTLWTILAVLALAGGWYARPYIMPRLKPTLEQIKPVTPPPVVTVADTDPFSVQLFKQALKEQESGNVLVAPRIISDTLLALRQLSGGKTQAELQALQLRETSTARATEPLCAVLLATDVNLPRKEGVTQVMALPFSEDIPMALSIFNGTLAAATHTPDIQMADSTLVTSRTRLLAGCTITMDKEWEIPFLSANGRTAEFNSATGSMPRFRQMRSRGAYRSAKAEDGSWKAIAIPFKRDTQTGTPLVYIGIQPATSARDFATQLTPEQLNTIRTALAAAGPLDTLVELPRMQMRIAPQNLRDSARRMGLKSLFDSESADFSALTTEKVLLSGLLFSAFVNMGETPSHAKADASLDYAKEYFSFTRPFIWLIADLNTNIPIEFMGLVEEM